MTETLTPINEIMERHMKHMAARKDRQDQAEQRFRDLLSGGWIPSDEDCHSCMVECASKAEEWGLVKITLSDGTLEQIQCDKVRKAECLLPDAQVNYRRKREEKRAKDHKKAERNYLQGAGIGARYLDVTRERLREHSEICAYLDDLKKQVSAGQGIMLLGPIGVGKTSTLALIARESFSARIDIWYTTVTRLMRRLLNDKFNPESFGSEEEYHPARCELLLLDEFGAAYESEYAMATFEDYVGWRYDNRMATCIAGNLTPDQIRANPHYSRMVDRWRETCRVIVIGGESQRRSC